MKNILKKEYDLTTRDILKAIVTNPELIIKPFERSYLIFSDKQIDIKNKEITLEQYAIAAILKNPILSETDLNNYFFNNLISQKIIRNKYFGTSDKIEGYKPRENAINYAKKQPITININTTTIRNYNYELAHIKLKEEIGTISNKINFSKEHIGNAGLKTLEKNISETTALNSEINILLIPSEKYYDAMKAASIPYDVPVSCKKLYY